MVSGMTKHDDTKRATLLVCCPDRPGIVAALTQGIFQMGANVLDADQHTDTSCHEFFQRTLFDLSAVKLDRKQIERQIQAIADRFDMRWQLYYEHQPKRVAVFVSRYDHCLWDLLLRHRAGELPCNIDLVIANHPDLEPIARQFDVEFHVFPIDKKNKHEQEDLELALLEERQIDLIVLARYMQILSSDFIARYPSRIINIHHSFLPAFIGRQPYHQAHERGVKLIGATAHYATADLDQGPILTQEVTPTTHRDSVQELIRRGRDVERSALSRAVRYHLEDRVIVTGNRTIVFS